jgi:hypothetical protein
MSNHPSGLTCVHAESGLCDACQADYDEDPESWEEFGSHPAGIANWEALQAEMRAWEPVIGPALERAEELPL